MKAQWIILIVVVVVLVIGILAFFFLKKGPDLSSYLQLKEPRITSRPNERVLEVKFSGPADTVIKKAYSVLFKTYFGLKGSPKGPAMKPPKARYHVSMDEASAEKKLNEFLAHDWTGSVAIPIPEGLDVPVGKPDSSGMVAQAGTWEYGDVAEILHLGSYETEPPTIQRLDDYIDASGYRILGGKDYMHEEEYLKGPGMMMVSPKDYWTVIRVRVEKAK